MLSYTWGHHRLLTLFHATPILSMFKSRIQDGGTVPGALTVSPPMGWSALPNQTRTREGGEWGPCMQWPCMSHAGWLLSLYTIWHTFTGDVIIESSWSAIFGFGLLSVKFRVKCGHLAIICNFIHKSTSWLFTNSPLRRWERAFFSLHCIGSRIFAVAVHQPYPKSMLRSIFVAR